MKGEKVRPQRITVDPEVPGTEKKLLSIPTFSLCGADALWGKFRARNTGKMQYLARKSRQSHGAVE